MAHQDVFVKITDVNGSRQSHSCRAKVYWVDTDIYFSNYANLEVYSAYNKKGDEFPMVTLSRRSVYVSIDDAPLMVDITALLDTATYLKIGDRVIDLKTISSDAERLFKEIVVSQLEGSAYASV